MILFSLFSSKSNTHFFLNITVPKLLNGSVCIEKTFENLISYLLYTLCGYNNSSSWYKRTLLYLVTEKLHANSFIMSFETLYRAPVLLSSHPTASSLSNQTYVLVIESSFDSFKM